LASLATFAFGACSPSPESPEPLNADAESDRSQPWATYLNEDFSFAFDHPQEVLVDPQTDGPFQVVIYADPERPFYIRATRDYLPSEVLYFLETPASGAITIGGYRWQTHLLPNGYGDAVGTSPPIYALRMEISSVLYSVIFFHQDALNELQLRILSTFRISD
jgi:hypothetical protein